MTVRCRSCQQPIRWATTPAGRVMPLDLDPHPDGNVRLGWVGGEQLALVLAGAELEAARIDDPRALYRSHFATCPDADRWRSGDQQQQLAFACRVDESGGVA